MDAWGNKVAELKKEDGEEPTAKRKASSLLEILSDQVQFTVAQGMSSNKLDYDTHHCADQAHGECAERHLDAQVP